MIVRIHKKYYSTILNSATVGFQTLQPTKNQL